jgi:DNA-binding PadR family transcriptional regulator
VKPLPAASLQLVLALLQGEAHGYALIGRVAELSDGAVRMGPGTLYGTLNRLVEDGLVEETTDRVSRDDSEPRRYHQLAPVGWGVAVDEARRLQAMVHRIARHLPMEQASTLLGGDTDSPTPERARKLATPSWARCSTAASEPLHRSSRSTWRTARPRSMTSTLRWQTSTTTSTRCMRRRRACFSPRTRTTLAPAVIDHLTGPCGLTLG